MGQRSVSSPPTTCPTGTSVSQDKQSHLHPDGRLDDNLKQEGLPGLRRQTERFVKNLENATAGKGVAGCQSGPGISWPWAAPQPARRCLLMSLEGFTPGAQAHCAPARVSQTLPTQPPLEAGRLNTEPRRG